jgi:hypothetical protein
MSIDLSFVGQGAGAMFLFQSVQGMKTLDFDGTWKDPTPHVGYSLMTMREPPDEPFTKPMNEVEGALIECMQNEFEYIYSSIESGYLICGYYMDDLFVETKVGYIYCPIYKTELCSGFSSRAKNTPPKWMRKELTSLL